MSCKKELAALAFGSLAVLGVMVTPVSAQRLSPLLQQPGVFRPNNPFANAFTPIPQLAPALSPFALSTVPGVGLSAATTAPFSGYSLSTSPGMTDPFNPAFGGGGYGYPSFPGFGPGGVGYGAGQALQGAAAYTTAQGEYWKSIQQARITREQSRQMAIDTARKQIQFEAWYETVRPTAPRMREAEAATELDRARREPPATEVWSGRSLNELLRSVVRAGRDKNRGPQILLNNDTLQHLNLTDKTGGNAGMLKMTDKEGKLALYWPIGLEGADFQEPRQRLTQNLREAVDALRGNGRPSATTVKDIQNDFKSLNDKLSNSADELSPSQYIEATRYMKQLDQAIRLLRDQRAANAFNGNWKAKGETVSELVDYMDKGGLEFGAATPGDEGAYTAMFQALRAYESGLQLALNQQR
jgi:hypothetical protein